MAAIENNKVMVSNMKIKFNLNFSFSTKIFIKKLLMNVTLWNTYHFLFFEINFNNFKTDPKSILI